jgi:hypothetical protein
MRAESNVRPSSFEIENISKERCDVVLNTNIEEIKEDENTKYSYDTYRLNICYDENIEERVRNNFDRYVNMAKELEDKKVAKEEIIKLQEELDNTDYKIIKCSEYQLAGLEIPYNIAELHANRQRLRDKINELQEL